MLGSKCTLRVSWVTFWGLGMFINDFLHLLVIQETKSADSPKGCIYS